MLDIGISIMSGRKSGRATHVFLLAGQSNMVGRASYDGGPKYPAVARQVARSPGGLSGAAEGAVVTIDGATQLDHVPTTSAGEMGLAMQFAIDYAAANPGVDLVFLPEADGGTGFQGGHWTVDGTDNQYDWAVTRANALFAANPTFQFKAILWHQGEVDAGNPDYADQLDALIEGFRADIAAASPDTPFILGQLLNRTGTIQTIIADTPNRVEATAVVDSEGLSGIDTQHFDAASLRTLGSRYASAYAALAEVQAWNLSAGAGAVTFISSPQPPAAPSVSAGNGAVTFS